MKNLSTSPSRSGLRKVSAARLWGWYESLRKADVRNLLSILAYCQKRQLPLRERMVKAALVQAELAARKGAAV